MTIKYKGNYYELVELKEPQKEQTYDIIGIFKSYYFKEENGKEIPITLEEFEKDFDGQWRLGEFIDYFYGANDKTQDIVEIAQWYIDIHQSSQVDGR